MPFNINALERLCEIVGVCELAEQMGVNRATIYKWCVRDHEPCPPNIDQMHRVARKYHGAKRLRFYTPPK